MSIEPADLQLFKYYRSCRFFYGNTKSMSGKDSAANTGAWPQSGRNFSAEREISVSNYHEMQSKWKI